MRDKQERIKSLAWKYFFQQKKKEIGGFLYYAWPFILIYIIEGLLLSHFTEEKIAVWFLAIFTTMLTSIVLSPVYFWIKSNWEEAMNRAKGEIK